MHTILKKREKIILYLTIGVIFFSIALNAVIIPVFSRYDAFNKEINLNKSRLKRYRTLLSQKGEIQAKYGRFSSGFQVTGNARDTLVTTMAAVENLAKSANIKIVDLRPQASAGRQANNNNIIIELRAEGAIEGFTKFIYDLETSLLLLKVKRFQLTAKPSQASLEGTFTITQPVVLK